MKLIRRVLAFQLARVVLLLGVLVATLAFSHALAG
jgi:hypothetical protein